MKLAVFGLGKLGLPLAALLASRGHDVIGVDPNPRNREAASGIALWDEPELADLLTEHAGRIVTTDDPAAAVAASSMALLIVPTPTGDTGAFSNDYVLTAVDQIGTALRLSTRTFDVVIVSTVMPGATGGVIRECLERASGRAIGADLGLLYSPLFIALGSVVRDMRSPDVVLIGEPADDSTSGSRLLAVLDSFQDAAPGRKVHRLPWAGAELAKLGINAFVTAKIAFANWMAGIAEEHGAPPARVLSAIASDSRIGAKYFSFGMPFGGPCFPRDNRAMALVAENAGLPGAMPRATDVLNDAQQARLLSAVLTSAAGRKVAVLGLAYKEGTPVTEESAGLLLAEAVHRQGLEVVVHDPLVTQTLVSQAATVAEAVAGAAVVVVTTRAYSEVAVEPDAIVINPWGVPITRSAPADRQ